MYAEPESNTSHWQVRIPGETISMFAWHKSIKWTNLTPWYLQAQKSPSIPAVQKHYNVWLENAVSDNWLIRFITTQLKELNIHESVTSKQHWMTHRLHYIMTERFTRVQTQNLQADEVLNFCCLSMPKHTKESQRVETPPLVWTPLSPQQYGPDLKGTNHTIMWPETMKIFLQTHITLTSENSTQSYV